MSNYPDDFGYSNTDYWYSADDDRPTWDDVKEIARRHLTPAFNAMAAELTKLANIVDCYAIEPADVSNLISMTISEAIPEYLHSDFVSALNEVG